MKHIGKKKKSKWYTVGVFSEWDYLEHLIEYYEEQLSDRDIIGIESLIKILQDEHITDLRIRIEGKDEKPL